MNSRIHGNPLVDTPKEKSAMKGAYHQLVRDISMQTVWGFQVVKKMIEMSAKAATDFIYLTWPWFDSDDYLKDLGFIPFPSSWPIHSCHVTTSDLKNILKELSLE